MDTTSITISFIVTIFGIAYPILFQVVSRLDEKYSSILVLELFNKEREGRLFKLSLIAALLSILIYILKLPPVIDFGRLNFLVNNSALLLLVITAILLVISFFYFVEKILIYYTPTRFLKYLIKKHEEQENNYSYFKAISDILYNSIKEQNETVVQTISNFLYETFQKERDKNVDSPVEYPVSFYEIIYKSIEELANLKSKKLTFLEYRTAGAVWLFGEMKDTKISKTTFRWIWSNLLLAIKYERDDMVIYYWQNAHRYYSYNLQLIHPEYSEDYPSIENKEQIESRNKEREKFLEFHYALGGLLFYRERFSCIRRIFNYTTCIPPKYELLPESMGELFEKYIEFRDPHERKFAWISHLYPFPELEGLNADYLIKNWIVKYIGILFIRQYSIQPHLITMKPLDLPQIPKTQSEKKIWLDNIDYLKSVVEEVFKNSNLLEKTNLSFITEEWLEEQEKPKPGELVGLYKTEIEKDFEKTEIEQKVSQEKDRQFKDSSKEIIAQTINLYNDLSNKELINANFNSCFIHGERSVISKSSFSDDTDAHHINFDTFLAEHISSKYKKGISETFFYTKTKTYLLEEKDIFPAIDKLGITKEYIIVGFSQNMDWLQSQSIEGLNEHDYKGISILNFSHSNHHLVGKSFFILKKSDLPNIIHRTIEESEIEKYKLDTIEDELKIYGSVSNLQERDDLLNELKPYHADKDLRKFVLINLALKTEIRWKKNINSVMIKTFSKYQERGVPDKLSDVKK